MLNLTITAWRGLKAQFAAWRQRQKAYAELSSLDDRSLADIGISRSEIPYLLSGPSRDAAHAKAGLSLNQDIRRAA